MQHPNATARLHLNSSGSIDLAPKSPETVENATNGQLAPTPADFSVSGRLPRGVTRAIRPRSTPVQPLATDGRNQLKFACNPPLMQENF
jgi:hypothetical protein